MIAEPVQFKKVKHRRSPRGPGFSIAQFANAFGISATSVREAVKRGDIKAIPFNGKLRIPFTEKKRFLETWGEPE